MLFLIPHTLRGKLGCWLLGFKMRLDPLDQAQVEFCTTPCSVDKVHCGAFRATNTT